MRRILIAMGVIIVALVLLVRFGSGYVAGKAAREYLAEHHIPASVLHMGHASLRSSSVKEARIGKDDALKLNDAVMDYGYRDKALDIRRIAAERLQISAHTLAGAWSIGGVETLAKLPTLDAQSINRALAITLDTALEVIRHDDALEIHTRNGTVSLTQDALSVQLKHLKSSLTPAGEVNHFNWTAKADGIVVTQKAKPMTTPLRLTMAGTADTMRIKGQGTVSDAAGIMPVIVNFNHEMKSQKTTLQWTSNNIVLSESGKGFEVLSPALAAMPKLQATLRMEGDAILQPAKKPRIKHRIIIDRAALSPLLKMAFKDDIAIDGDVSGTIPLRWAGEKAPQVIGASFKNTAPGTLIYDPLTGASAALQGEAQAGILLEALRKFQYTTLDITADSDKDGVLKASFHIVGANPDLYGGKTIDFTLNVNGNLLSILESQAKVHDVISKTR